MSCSPEATLSPSARQARGQGRIAGIQCLPALLVQSGQLHLQQEALALRQITAELLEHQVEIRFPQQGLELFNQGGVVGAWLAVARHLGMKASEIREALAAFKGAAKDRGLSLKKIATRIPWW